MSNLFEDGQGVLMAASLEQKLSIFLVVVPEIRRETDGGEETGLSLSVLSELERGIGWVGGGGGGRVLLELHGICLVTSVGVFRRKRVCVCVRER